MMIPWWLHDDLRCPWWFLMISDDSLITHDAAKMFHYPNLIPCTKLQPQNKVQNEFATLFCFNHDGPIALQNKVQINIGLNNCDKTNCYKYHSIMFDPWNAKQAFRSWTTCYDAIRRSNHVLRFQVQKHFFYKFFWFLLAKLGSVIQAWISHYTLALFR